MHFDRHPNSDSHVHGGRSRLVAGPRWVTWLVLAALSFTFSAGVGAQELQDLRAANLGAGNAQLALRFSDAPPDASIFAIDSPPRISIDLPGVSNRLPSRTTEFGVGALHSVTAVEAGERTRVILNLGARAGYRTHVDGSSLIVTLGPGVADTESVVPPAAGTPPPDGESVSPASPVADGSPSPRAGVRSARPPEINDIDFRRGNEGQGRVIVELSRAGVNVGVLEQAGRIELTFPNVLLDEGLERRLNVIDFATPVSSVETFRERGGRVRMVVNTTGPYEVVSFQSETTYVLEVVPITELERDRQARLSEDRHARLFEDRDYVGDRLSLNFQDIEVRSVLQLLAEFTGQNIVVSDRVAGNITLRLDQVPWDLALDLILTTQGLDKRVTDTVMYVAPEEDLFEGERRRREAEEQRRLAQLALEQQAPLVLEIIPVSFVQAEAIARLIQPGRDIRDPDLRVASRGDHLALAADAARVSFLTPRGTVAVDERTNNLIVRDIAESIKSIRELVARLDTPTRQVLIETRVVIADENYRRDLGARFGVSAGSRQGRSNFGLSGTLEASEEISQGLATGNPGIPSLGNRLNSALPVTDAGSLGFSLLRPNILLDLELSALQREGRGEVISSPRVITANGQKAMIQQGEEIPFLSTGDGGTNVEFRDALLQTEVKPQITPNGNVIMDIKVTKNEVNFQRQVQGNPAISKREIETSVVVADGETVVLGGVYEIGSSTNLEMVPFFGEIPFLKHFFRNRTNENRKAELLIFVTPRVLD